MNLRKNACTVMSEVSFFVDRGETWMKRSHFSEKLTDRFVNDGKN